MDVWRNSVAQLQMDGVPLERIMNGGVLCVVHAIKRLSRGGIIANFPQAYQSLEKWRYDSSLDSSTTKTLDAGHHSPKLFTEHNGTYVTDKSDEAHGNDEYSDAAYPWPDEAKRFKVLVLHNGHGELPSASDRGQPTMMIQLCPRNPMGQNRVTTLHYLIRIMKNVAQDLFGGPLPLDDDDFRRTVWFHMPEGKWRVYSVEEPMERLEWVFHFMHEGTMPIEAQRVKEALRLLAKSPLAGKLGAMLASSLHPYNQSSDCTITAELIGPDLCPEWFNIIIPSQAASELSSILFRLHGLRLSRHNIQRKYGILIAHLHEEQRPNGCGVSENATSHSLHSDSECQGFFGSKINLTRGRETIDELSSLTPARSEIGTSLKDKTLGPLCICRNNKEVPMLHCSDCSQWFHVECVNMADSLVALVKTYFCLNCTSETQQTTFIRRRRPRTTKDNRAAASETASASTVIPQLDDASGVKPCRQFELRPSTLVRPVAEPHMPSRILRSQSRKEQIAAETQASTNLSKISVARRGTKRKRVPDSRIDQDFGRAMTALHSNKRVSLSTSLGEAAIGASQRADMSENSNSRRAKGRARKGSWSPREDEWLQNYKQRHPESSPAETTSAFNEKFPTRSKAAILQYLLERGLTFEMKGRWSTEEDEWILDLMRRQPDILVTSDVANEFNRNFKPRTKSTISQRVGLLDKPLGRKVLVSSPEKNKWLLENRSLKGTRHRAPELRAFEAEFGHSVTRRWMNERLNKLDPVPQLKHAPDELLSWLRSELASRAVTGTAGFRRITKDLNDHFVTSYSQGAIVYYARTRINGKATPAVSSLYVPWTQDQREWLAATIERGALPPLTPPQLADSFYNRFGVRRTDISLQPEIYALGGQKTWMVGALRWIVEAVGSGISWGPMVALYQARFEGPVSSEQLRRVYEELISSENARARVETSTWTIEKACKGGRVRGRTYE